jgi:dihydroxyacetone kinase-like protein
MNVKMAMRLAAAEGIRVATVVANDDVASAAPEESNRRRGVAGEILMWKVAGARAAAGASLEEVVVTASRAMANTRSIGIGLTSCTIPAVGTPNFLIEPGKMEVGIGHHGEPGVSVEDLRPARDIASRMVDMVLGDLPFGSGDEVAVLVSGLGATTLMEQYILYGDVTELLDRAGIGVHRAYVGNYFTSLEMMGVTLTLMRLDDELRSLIDTDVDSAGWRQFGGLR